MKFLTVLLYLNFLENIESTFQTTQSTSANGPGFSCMLGTLTGHTTKTSSRQVWIIHNDADHINFIKIMAMKPSSCVQTT